MYDGSSAAYYGTAEQCRGCSSVRVSTVLWTASSCQATSIAANNRRAVFRVNEPMSIDRTRLKSFESTMKRYQARKGSEK